MRLLTSLSLFALLGPAAWGQSLVSFGIKGGVPLNDAFSDRTFLGVDTFTHTFSDSKNYVIGPTAELRLPLGFSVEADALYRPLSLVSENTIVSGSTTVRSATDISAWEFPILGKYHFLHTPIVKPYVEAGPIFRALGSSGSYLSNSGFAMGAGVDVKVLVVRLEPEIRYSRWGGDAAAGPGFFTAPSNQNQAEFLIGISF
ncbi:MAG TPA: hypothetical protein VMH80_22800 [Bryobacteraceae bacterium]|nr:hypothetical protein [Bryobacteraceae bacterium]